MFEALGDKASWRPAARKRRTKPTGMGGGGAGVGPSRVYSLLGTREGAAEESWAKKGALSSAGFPPSGWRKAWRVCFAILPLKIYFLMKNVKYGEKSKYNKHP